jgi:surface protein
MRNKYELLNFLAKGIDPKRLVTTFVTYMDRLFESCSSFNGDISAWDTSNVADMR